MGKKKGGKKVSICFEVVFVIGVLLVSSVVPNVTAPETEPEDDAGGNMLEEVSVDNAKEQVPGMIDEILNGGGVTDTGVKALSNTLDSSVDDMTDVGADLTPLTLSYLPPFPYGGLKLYIELELVQAIDLLDISYKWDENPVPELCLYVDVQDFTMRYGHPSQMHKYGSAHEKQFIEPDRFQFNIGYPSSDVLDSGSWVIDIQMELWDLDGAGDIDKPQWDRYGSKHLHDLLDINPGNEPGDYSWIWLDDLCDDTTFDDYAFHQGKDMWDRESAILHFQYDVLQNKLIGDYYRYDTLHKGANEWLNRTKAGDWIFADGGNDGSKVTDYAGYDYAKHIFDPLHIFDPSKKYNYWTDPNDARIKFTVYDNFNHFTNDSGGTVPTLEFGMVEGDNSSNMAVTLTNNGDRTITGGTVSLEVEYEAYSDEFQLIDEDNNIGETLLIYPYLATGETATYSVLFQPKNRNIMWGTDEMPEPRRARLTASDIVLEGERTSHFEIPRKDEVSVYITMWDYDREGEEPDIGGGKSTDDLVDISMCPGEGADDNWSPSGGLVGGATFGPTDAMRKVKHVIDNYRGAVCCVTYNLINNTWWGDVRGSSSGYCWTSGSDDGGGGDGNDAKVRFKIWDNWNPLADNEEDVVRFVFVDIAYVEKVDPMDSHGNPIPEWYWHMYVPETTLVNDSCQPVRFFNDHPYYFKPEPEYPITITNPEYWSIPGYLSNYNLNGYEALKLSNIYADISGFTYGVPHLSWYGWNEPPYGYGFYQRYNSTNLPNSLSLYVREKRGSQNSSQYASVIFRNDGHADVGYTVELSGDSNFSTSGSSDVTWLEPGELARSVKVWFNVPACKDGSGIEAEKPIKQNATLYINGTNGQSLQVSFTGTQQGDPQLDVKPEHYLFMNQTNSSVPVNATFTVRNNNSGVLKYRLHLDEKSGENPFELDVTLPFWDELHCNETRQFTVTFNPNLLDDPCPGGEPASYFADIIVMDSRTGQSDDFEVMAGVIPPSRFVFAHWQQRINNWSYGEVPVGTSQTERFNPGNIGEAGNWTVKFDSPEHDGFALLDNESNVIDSFSFSIEKYEGCDFCWWLDIPVRFSPTEPENYTATLVATGDSTATLQLSGTATAPPVAIATGPTECNQDELTHCWFFSDKSYDPDEGRHRIVSLEWNVFDQYGNLCWYDMNDVMIIQYLDNGSYTINLTVKDDEGDTDTDSIPFLVSGGDCMPYAYISPPKGSLMEGSAVIFDASWSGDGDTDGIGIVNYTWDFDNDKTWDSTTLTPTTSHIYDTKGNYTVRILVYDDEGNTAIGNRKFTIYGYNPPIAKPGGPYSGMVGKIIWFNGSGSCDNDEYHLDTHGYVIVNWTWDFGNGSLPTYGQHVNHIYDTEGTYTVTLTVTDNENDTHAANTTVFIEGYSPPTADAGGPYFGSIYETITFDGSGSFDNDEHIINTKGHDIVDYLWDMGDGTVKYGRTVSHAYSDLSMVGKIYTVMLTVMDNEQMTNSTTADVYLSPSAPPTAVAVGPHYCLEYEPLTFHGMDSYDNDEDGVAIVDWKWDFDDTSSEEHGKQIVHTYMDDDVYNVTLQVKDDEGTWSEITTKRVTVINNPPTADFTVKYLAPYKIQFDGGLSKDPHPARDDLYYFWDLNGDGSWDYAGGYSTAGVVTWNYTERGVKNVTLMVMNPDGVGTMTRHVVAYTWEDIIPLVANQEAFLSYPACSGYSIPHLLNEYGLIAPNGWFYKVRFICGSQIKHEYRGSPTMGGGMELFSKTIKMSAELPETPVVIEGYASYGDSHPSWVTTLDTDIRSLPDWYVEYLKNAKVSIVYGSNYTNWTMNVIGGMGLDFGKTVPCSGDKGKSTEGIDGSYGINLYESPHVTVDLSGKTESGLITKFVIPLKTVKVKKDVCKQTKKPGWQPYGSIESQLTVSLVIDLLQPPDKMMYLIGSISISGEAGYKVKYSLPINLKGLADGGLEGKIGIKTGIGYPLGRLDSSGFNFSPPYSIDLNITAPFASLKIWAEVLWGLIEISGGLEIGSKLTIPLPAGKPVTLNLYGTIDASITIAKIYKWHTGHSITVSIASPANVTITPTRHMETKTMDLLFLKSSFEESMLPLHHSPWVLSKNVDGTATPKIAVLSDGHALAVWTDTSLSDNSSTPEPGNWLQSDVYWSIYDGINWSAPQSTNTSTLCEYNPVLHVARDEHGKEHIILTYLCQNGIINDTVCVDTFYANPMLKTAVWNTSHGWSFKGGNISITSGDAVNAIDISGYNDTVYLTYLIDTDACPLTTDIGRIYVVNGTLHGGMVDWDWDTSLLIDEFNSSLFKADCSPKTVFINDTHGGVFHIRKHWNTTTKTNDTELVFNATTSGLQPVFTEHIIRTTNESISSAHAETINDAIVFTWVENHSRICQCMVAYNASTSGYDIENIQKIYADVAIFSAKPFSNGTTQFILFNSGEGFIPHVIEQLANGSWGKLRPISIGDHYSQGHLDGDAAGTHGNIIYLRDTPITEWFIGRWRFNEGAGTTTNDESANSNNGILKGNTSWVEHADTNGSLPPYYGSCLSFNDTDGYIEVPHTDGLNVTDELTLCVWLNRSTSSAAPTKIAGKNGSWALIDDNNNLTIKFWRTDGIITETIAPLPLNTWTFISVIYNHGRLNVTIRPKGLANVTVEHILGDMSINGSTYPLIIGGFNGSIDEIWLFNRDISMSEVNSIWFSPYVMLGSVHDVVVQELPPYASFTYTILGKEDNASVTTEDMVQFTATPPHLNYFWDFGDGAIACGNVTTHQYACHGLYTVICNATDPDTGITTPLTQVIHVDDTTSPIFAGLHTVLPGENSAMLSWNEATDTSSFIYYYVYLSDESGIYNFSKPCGITNDTSYVVTGLTAGTTYYFVVKAMDSYGNMDDNMVERSTTPYDITAPNFTGLEMACRITNVAHTVLLSWNPAADVSHPITYNIYMANVSLDYNFSAPLGSTTDTYYVIEHLTGNHPYYFVVRAIDFWGNNDSNMVEHNITPAFDLTPPTTSKIAGDPRYGPADSYVTSSTEFQFSAVDSDTAVDETFYRLYRWGTWAPLMKYNGTFTLQGDGTYYLEYFSVDTEGNAEPPHTDIHYVDNTPPTVIIDPVGPYKKIGPDKYYVTSLTEINLIAVESQSWSVGVASLEYRSWLNGSWTPWMPYTMSLMFSEHATHFLEIQATDLLGNTVTENISFIVIRLDGGIIGCTITDGDFRNKSNDTLGVTLKNMGEDNISSRVGFILETADSSDPSGWKEIDSGNKGPYDLDPDAWVESFFDVVYDVEGEYRATFSLKTNYNDYPVDPDADPINDIYQAVFTVDFPPIADFTFSPIKPLKNQVIHFEDLSHDTYGAIVNWTWAFGDGYSSYEQHPMHQYTRTGTYQVRLTVYDNNYEYDTLSRRLTVYTKSSQDHIPPATSTLFDGPYYTDISHKWICPDTNIVLMAEDFGAYISGVARTMYKLDNGSYMSYSGNITIPTAGMHTLYYYSVDNAGNIEGLHAVTLHVDDYPPTADMWFELAGDTVVPCTDEEGKLCISSDYSICLSANDTGILPSGLQDLFYQINGGGWQNYTGSITFDHEGEYVFEYNAIDNVHNHVLYSVTIIIDDSPPETTSIIPMKRYLHLFGRPIMPLPLEQTVIIGDIDATYEGTDTSGIQKVEFYVDGDLQHTAEEAPFVWTWDTFAIGYRTLEIVATDNLGHSTTEKMTVLLFNL